MNLNPSDEVFYEKMGFVLSEFDGFERMHDA